MGDVFHPTPLGSVGAIDFQRADGHLERWRRKDTGLCGTTGRERFAARGFTACRLRDLNTMTDTRELAAAHQVRLHNKSRGRHLKA